MEQHKPYNIDEFIIALQKTVNEALDFIKYQDEEIVRLKKILDYLNQKESNH